MFKNISLNITDSNKWAKFFKCSYVLIILLIIYLPWLTIVLMSFFSANKKQNASLNFSQSFNNGKNYIDFFVDPGYYGNFWSSFTNSIIIAIFTIPISLCIGLITAISIWKNNNKSKNSTFMFSNMSIGMPDVIQGICFYTLFLTCLIPAGINFGFFTLILSHIAFSVPYVIIFLYPKISKLNIQLLYASYDLNYKTFETINKIIIPIILPNIISVSFLIFSLSFDDFVITNLVRGNLNTLTSELYVMKKGVKAWAITFGAIVFWISILVGIFSIFWNEIIVSKSRKNDPRINN